MAEVKIIDIQKIISVAQSNVQINAEIKKPEIKTGNTPPNAVNTVIQTVDSRNKISSNNYFSEQPDLQAAKPISEEVAKKIYVEYSQTEPENQEQQDSEVKENVNAQYLEKFNFDELSASDRTKIINGLDEIDKILSDDPNFAEYTNKVVGITADGPKLKEYFIGNIEYYKGNIERAKSDIDSWIKQLKNDYAEFQLSIVQNEELNETSDKKCELEEALEFIDLTEDVDNYDVSDIDEEVIIEHVNNSEMQTDDNVPTVDTRTSGTEQNNVAGEEVIQRAKDAVKKTTGADLDNIDISNLSNRQKVADITVDEASSLEAVGMKRNQKGGKYAVEFTVRLANMFMGNESSNTLTYIDTDGSKKTIQGTPSELDKACQSHPYNPQESELQVGYILGFIDPQNGNKSYGVVVGETDDFVIVEEARSKTNNGSTSLVAYSKNPKKGEKRMTGYIPTTQSMFASDKSTNENIQETTQEETKAEIKVETKVETKEETKEETTTNKSVEEENKESEEAVETDVNQKKNNNVAVIEVRTDKELAELETQKTGSDKVEYTNKIKDELFKQLDNAGLGDDKSGKFEDALSDFEGTLRDDTGNTVSADDLVEYITKHTDISEKEVQQIVYGAFNAFVQQSEKDEENKKLAEPDIEQIEQQKQREIRVNEFKEQNAQYLGNFDFDSLSEDEQKAVMDEFDAINKKFEENPDLVEYLKARKTFEDINGNNIAKVMLMTIIERTGNVENSILSLEIWFMNVEPAAQKSAQERIKQEEENDESEQTSNNQSYATSDLDDINSVYSKINEQLSPEVSREEYTDKSGNKYTKIFRADGSYSIEKPFRLDKKAKKAANSGATSTVLPNYKTVSYNYSADGRLTSSIQMGYSNQPYQVLEFKQDEFGIKITDTKGSDYTESFNGDNTTQGRVGTCYDIATVKSIISQFGEEALLKNVEKNDDGSVSISYDKKRYTFTLDEIYSYCTDMKYSWDQAQDGMIYLLYEMAEEKSRNGKSVDGGNALCVAKKMGFNAANNPNVNTLRKNLERLYSSGQTAVTLAFGANKKQDGTVVGVDGKTYNVARAGGAHEVAVVGFKSNPQNPDKSIVVISNPWNTKETFEVYYCDLIHSKNANFIGATYISF